MKTVLGGLLVLAAALAFAQPALGSDRTLHRYAEGTWRSFDAMTDERTGFPADSLKRDGTRSVQTSTTNIGAYMWSAVVAEELGIIRRSELASRMRRTVSTLEDLERHTESGQFYNWYDHRTGAKLTTWPPSGNPLVPILSSVDNGWLAVGLKIVADRVPELSKRASELYDSMDFGIYYDDGRQPDPAALRAEHRLPAMLLRHDRQREPDRQLHRHRQGRAARSPLLRRLPVLPGLLRLQLDRDEAIRLHALVPRHAGIRRLAALQRHAGHAGLGREHVRGA